MQHCTPEQLALAALREPLPESDTAHLASCERCQAEVTSLRRSVDALAVPQLAAPGPSVAPPPGLWEAISAATGVSAAPRPEVLAAAAAPGTATSAAEVTPAAPATPVAERPAPAVVPPAPPSDTDAKVLPFRSRRRPVLLVAAAVLAGAVVGAGAVAVLRGGNGAETVEAVALNPLDGNDASGRATVVVRDDGSRALEVDLDAPALDDRYYEIWLIDRDVVGMVPLGVVRPGTQTFELPGSLDLGQFPLVDVSVEPLDGNPEHSGVSVTRGELDS